MSSRRPNAKPDHSVLRPSIEVANTGMRQALLAMKCGSPEVIEVLLHECNLIYECKVCFNMFRSLANLISHKRSFCRNRCRNVLHMRSNDDDAAKIEAQQVVIVQPEPVETLFPEKEFDLLEYSPSIELLKEAGILAEIEERPLIDTLKPTKHSQSKLPDIIKRLKTIQACKDESDSGHYVFLEPMKQTTKAVFQNLSKAGDQGTMGNRYAELVKARQLASAFVGPNNKIIEPGSSSCSFVSRSSSPSVCSSEMSYKPSKGTPAASRFPCTKCPAAYTRMYRTINHMMKVHDLEESKIPYERKFIRIKANYYGNLVKKEPILKLERLSESRKSLVSKSESFKLAMDSVTKTVQVSLRKLSPSKIGLSSENVVREEEKKNLNHSSSSDSDNEVVITKHPAVPSSKRSRSSSPISNSSDSSKIENASRNGDTKRPLNPMPKRRRSALTAKLENNAKSPDESSKKSLLKNKELHRLLNGDQIKVIKFEGRQTRRGAGPASVMKRRELKLLKKK